MGFYILKSDGLRFGTKWAYGQPVAPKVYGSARGCPVCGRAVSGKEYLPPHFIHISSAKPEKWGDFLWGAGFQLMVSKRFQEIYEEEHLRGVEKFYPMAEIVRMGRQKRGNLALELPAYHLVEIEWNGANLDDERSQTVRRQPDCSFCRGSVKAHRGVFLEEGTWTGADIFIARGLNGVILASERLKQVIEQNSLTNVQLIPAQKYVYDETQPGLWSVAE